MSLAQVPTTGPGADENGKSVAQTLDILKRTAAKDKEEHASEYGAAS